MFRFIRNFRKDEDGAVTVDWVVLTAAVVALAGLAYGSIKTGTTGLTSKTATYLQSQEPGAAGNGAGAGGGEGGGGGENPG
ncbi:hypothetical protein [Pukyongiella litopenaei]|uniref:Pilus assembly protein n=1 Tax=Pukyongiella litopenaei TaxID=2605946 RepID=A0A2S0MM62_9RHOB|nr:hypothetical protein [Pukyongiella litopenaei]AVO36773.1 hypothetical protein C6Y53_03080 [Pukyongiella litopenaei]